MFYNFCSKYFESLFFIDAYKFKVHAKSQSRFESTLGSCWLSCGKGFWKIFCKQVRFASMILEVFTYRWCCWLFLVSYFSPNGTLLLGKDRKYFLISFNFCYCLLFISLNFLLFQNGYQFLIPSGTLSIILWKYDSE